MSLIYQVKRRDREFKLASNLLSVMRVIIFDMLFPIWIRLTKQKLTTFSILIDMFKSRHVAWAQLLWRSFGVMGFVCQHCGCLMRLRSVAIYPPATTKILRGLGVNLHGLGFTGPR